MKIAVVGCSHGELDRIYEIIGSSHQNQTKIELLICCGDFQSTRNEADLQCMAVPKKFYNIGSFYKYYSGEKIAPILTLFIGGNHEASNFLQELPYGGWVAPKIYYLGYAGIVNFGGLRIGGISGIFKGGDYMKGHFEKIPYDNGTMRSVYHTRNVDVFRLKQLSKPLDIMLSHDWPRRIYHHGPVNILLKNKPFFENDINNDNLGSKPNEELLQHLKPRYWFAAHLHTKFTARVLHGGEDESDQKCTEFLALDKCLPRRQWFKIMDIPTTDETLNLSYDLEWLTILFLTDHLTSADRTLQMMPDSKCGDRWCFTPTDEEKQFVFSKMNEDLTIPDNFEKTAVPYSGYGLNRYCPQPSPVKNPQTVDFCKKLGVTDPLSKLVKLSSFDDVPASENASSSFSWTPDRRDHGATPSRSNYSSTPDRYYRSSTSEKLNSSISDGSYWSFNNSDCSDSSSLAYSNRSSIPLGDSESSPLPEKTVKKPKIEFPSIRETEVSSDTGEVLFCIDRTGSQPLPSSKPVFKRRNASIYAESESGND